MRVELARREEAIHRNEHRRLPKESTNSTTQKSTALYFTPGIDDPPPIII